MTFEQYQFDAGATARLFDTIAENLNHAALGISSESGEFAGIVKRIVIYDKEIDQDLRLHMIEELGDTLWYIALAAGVLGIPLRDIAAANIRKLRERYPDQFTKEAAEARRDKGGKDAFSS